MAGIVGLDLDHGPDEAAGLESITDAPTRHGVALGEGADEDEILAHARRMRGEGSERLASIVEELVGLV